MTIKEAIDSLNISIAEASRITQVPYRTIQNWYLGLRKCPDYVERLVIKVLLSSK